VTIEALTLFEPEPSQWRLRRCRVCRGTLAQTHSRHGSDPVWTYVMQRQGWVKIGLSKHPLTRLKELRAINRQCYIITPEAMDCREPILLVALIPGDVEHALHERFVDRHAAGEWFLPDAPIREWIATLAGAVG
jgi:hypothetical protein